MKPCAQNRKLIVWLSLNALEAQSARQLRAHLETCEGCRRYWVEISNVTEKLAAAEATPDVQASESFHRKVAGRFRSAKPDSFGEILAAYFARLNWDVALAAIAALVIVGIAVVIWRQPSEVASLPPAGNQTALISEADSDLAPTIANYQRVASQSLDKLDALLTKQGNRALPPVPVYTALTPGLAKGTF